jgi:uncharacterized RDD family membrane protein YckC
MRTEVAYAGFWFRLLAYLIDTTLLYAVGSMIMAKPLYDAATRYLNLVDSLAASGKVSLAGLSTTADSFWVLLNAALVVAAIGWAYYAVLESSPARGTLGKVALGLFVGDVHGDPISFWRATARYLFKTVSTLFLMLGWVMAATLVLRKKSYIVIGEEPPVAPGDYWDGTRWVASVTPSLSVENQ